MYHRIWYFLMMGVKKGVWGGCIWKKKRRLICLSTVWTRVFSFVGL